MARSRNKHSRAALRNKARRQRSRGTSRWFTVTITVVVVVGIVGVVLAAGLFSRDDSASAISPSPPTADNPSGDHWHAAFAVNICGEWLPDPAEFETAAGNAGVRTGIHTHGDGFIHIHPFYSSEGGDNATLGKFLDYGGWSASNDSIRVWTGPSAAPQKTEWRNGDRCPDADGTPGKGEPGRVVFEVNCKTVTGDPSDHKLADQEVVAIGFVPKGVEIGAPPNAASAPEDDGSPSGPIDQVACRPSAQNNPGVAETTPTTAATGTTTPPTTQP
jgi:hypothetical protein